MDLLCAMTERPQSIQSYGPGGPGMDVCQLFLVAFTNRLLCVHVLSILSNAAKQRRRQKFFFGFTSGAAFHPYSTSELIELIILSLV